MPTPPPKDGRTRLENTGTQPIRHRRVFNNPDVVAQGWYPICSSAELKRGKARSVLITFQRIVVWRGEDGQPRALDAFCPHMGANLANGDVVGNDIRCYFHRWQYSGSGGLTRVPCRDDLPEHVRTRAWPAQDAHGHVWVFAGDEATYPVPGPPGLEGQPLVVRHLTTVTLFAHHHAMMAGGIDLQHFSAVHGLDVDFDFTVDDSRPGMADWRVRGQLVSTTGWRSRLASWLLGGTIAYDARFAGGSLVTLTYGPGARFRGRGFALPTLHILWGCTARADGISQVDVFLMAPRRPGLTGWFVAQLRIGLTLALLTVLAGDDVKAFPYMRFDPRHLIAEDNSVGRLIQFIETLPLSPWTKPKGNAP